MQLAQNFALDSVLEQIRGQLIRPAALLPALFPTPSPALPGIPTPTPAPDPSADFVPGFCEYLSRHVRATALAHGIPDEHDYQREVEALVKQHMSLSTQTRILSVIEAAHPASPVDVATKDICVQLSSTFLHSFASKCINSNQISHTLSDIRKWYAVLPLGGTQPMQEPIVEQEGANNQGAGSHDAGADAEDGAKDHGQGHAKDNIDAAQSRKRKNGSGNTGQPKRHHQGKWEGPRRRAQSQ
ncbi:hypothetical protein F5Y04DRAFT_278246 [Hypomontagnella monticulosa]|nr:hypothetical protein F5Y04DRAFT_278246 [Hypomontagnella monticulosa]